MKKKNKTCNCPAYDFPHRMGSGECGTNCQHPEVEYEWRLVCLATQYQPAEYVCWATCTQCGEGMDYEDVPEWAEVIE